MSETLKRLWDERAVNGMTIIKLQNAVAKKWINADEYKTICGEDYIQPQNI